MNYALSLKSKRRTLPPAPFRSRDRLFLFPGSSGRSPLYYTGSGSCFFGERIPAWSGALRQSSTQRVRASPQRQIEQELTEGTEGSPLSLLAPVLRAWLRLRCAVSAVSSY